MRQIVFLLALMVAATGDRTVADDAVMAPMRIVTGEPGVIPRGTALVVRTKDTINTRNAYRGTVYLAIAPADLLDQSGNVLIPKESPFELAVRSLSYLGPGGVGMTLLTLDVETVTVNGTRYPVEIDDERPGAGGIGVDRTPVKWIGGSEPARGHVLTRGQAIDVPTDSLLQFQIHAPIRLRGYGR